MLYLIFFILIIIIVNINHLVVSFTFTHANFKQWENYAGCISKYEAVALLKYQKQVKKEGSMEIELSIDMGVSLSDLLLDNDGVKLNNKLLINWSQLKKVAKKESRCYTVYDNDEPWHVSTLSETTGNPASLCSPLNGQGPPTIILGGFTMHRLTGDNMNPGMDTVQKIKAANIRKGSSILDTCMGLGYTAIGAAKAVGSEGSVTTIEYDDASVVMCAHNPHSKGLYDGNHPIRALRGNSCELIKHFDDESFDYIIHDPPARALTKTDLYGLEFYIELRRVLKSSGTLYHYIGNRQSKESGRLYNGIKSRLLDAGFKSTSNVDVAFGMVANK